MHYGEEVCFAFLIYTAEACLSQTGVRQTQVPRQYPETWSLRREHVDGDGDGAEMGMHGKTRGLWDGDCRRATLLVQNP